jgi:hypothetical protein
MAAKCFACDRRLGRDPLLVDTRDGQLVHVGSECGKLVIEAGELGYQPPKGGPRLWPLMPVAVLDAGKEALVGIFVEDRMRKVIASGAVKREEKRQTLRGLKALRFLALAVVLLALMGCTGGAAYRDPEPTTYGYAPRYLRTSGSCRR